MWGWEELVPGEMVGQGRKEENGASHNFAYQKQWQHKSNLTITLIKPPATAFKKERKNLTKHISKSETTLYGLNYYSFH